MRLKLSRLKKQKAKPESEVDESVVTPLLMKHWRSNDTAMSYLKTRFPNPDATGDFLKSIIAARA